MAPYKEDLFATTMTQETQVTEHSTKNFWKQVCMLGEAFLICSSFIKGPLMFYIQSALWHTQSIMLIAYRTFLLIRAFHG